MGQAIVHRLAAGGAMVATTARSAPADIQADISTREGVDKVVRQIDERFDGLDILVNNLGGSTAPGGRARALSDDDWQRTPHPNLLPPAPLPPPLPPATLEPHPPATAPTP